MKASPSDAGRFADQVIGQPDRPFGRASDVATDPNAFAHAATDIGFATPEVSDATQNFAILNAADCVPEGLRMPRDKHGYLLVVQIILLFLDTELRNRGYDVVMHERP